MNRLLITTALAGGFSLCAPSAWAVSSIELIVNGGFEAGLTGWTVTNQGSGDWYIDDAIGGTTSSDHATVGPASGASYAVSDQPGGGVHALHQLFAVPSTTPASVVLTFEMFVNDWSSTGPIVNPAGLTHVSGSNQHARVDLLTSAAPPFETGAGVLANFYLGVDAGADPHPYTHYSFDITSLVAPGGTYTLRFAEVDNQLWLNQGVDDVSIAYTPVPEPTALAMLCVASLAALSSRQARSVCCGRRPANVA